MTSATRCDFPRLLEIQKALEARMDELCCAPRQILAIGADVLKFAEQEEPALFPLLPLLDPAARAELAGEHAQLAEDLELLASLVEAEADEESADAVELAAALASRMRRHIQRDGRLLVQAARLAQS